MVEEVEVTITSTGAGGDGIAEGPGGTLFVPFAAPGDRVLVRPGDRRGHGRAAEIVQLLAAGPERVAPPCPHFGTCGACALQHVSAAAYASWLTGRITGALAHRGLVADAIDPPIVVAPGTRRRARLGLARQGKAYRLGFHGRRRAEVVPIDECPVLRPDIVAALPALARSLGPLMARGGGHELEIAATETGLDVMVIGRKHPDASLLVALTGAAAQAGIARLSWRAGEDIMPVAALAPVRVTFSGIAIDVPPGAFLQPTAEGEAALVTAVTAALRGTRRAVDLFAGCGPFTFALAAQGAQVAAYESSPTMVDALDRAARRAGLTGRITAHARNLDRQPLMAAELDRADAVVLDPPRGGAATQARAIAVARVPAVVYVSCDPASFARDARLLADGGYRLERVIPIGQFLWSAEVELVGIFARPGSR